MSNRYERQISNEERRFYAEYAFDLAQKFRKGYLTQLTSYPQFVAWRHIYRDGKYTKPPYSPRTGEMADPTDPKTWGTIRQALDSLATGKFHGIGFVLTDKDPFVGVDLDECVGNNRRINKREADIVKFMNSYTEYSPTDGLHILSKGDLPVDSRKGEGIELYRSKRYLTLTLRHVPGTPMRIEPRLAEQKYLYDYLTPQVQNTVNTWSIDPESKQKQDITHELTEGKLKRFWKGDHWLWEGKFRWYPSKSEADFMFCLKLLELTNGDTEQTKRLFKASGMVDSKTDSLRGQRTYLDLTVENALRLRQKRQKN